MPKAIAQSLRRKGFQEKDEPAPKKAIEEGGPASQPLLREAALAAKSKELKQSSLAVAPEVVSASNTTKVSSVTGLHKASDEDVRAALLKLGDQAALSTLYGFTRKEAHLVTMLAKGKHLKEAASELTISLHAVRVHLKRIFMKADMTRVGIRPRIRTAK